MATIPHTTTSTNKQKPNNVNVKKYYFVKVSKEKENNSKLQQTGTKIFVWQAVAIKQKALDKTDQVWKSYGRELRRIISLGLAADNKQQQTPIFTIKQNEGILIPAGSKHQLSNRHETDLVFTVTSTPPSHGDRIEI